MDDRLRPCFEGEGQLPRPDVRDLQLRSRAGLSLRPIRVLGRRPSAEAAATSDWMSSPAAGSPSSQPTPRSEPQTCPHSPPNPRMRPVDDGAGRDHERSAGPFEYATGAFAGRRSQCSQQHPEEGSAGTAIVGAATATCSSAWIRSERSRAILLPSADSGQWVAYWPLGSTR